MFEPLGHFEAVQRYEENAKHSLRRFALTFGYVIEGWHVLLDRNPVEIAGHNYLAVSGTVIAKCEGDAFFCVKFGLSLSPGKTVRYPDLLPLNKVRRLEKERAEKLAYSAETHKFDVTPVR